MRRRIWRQLAVALVMCLVMASCGLGDELGLGDDEETPGEELNADGESTDTATEGEDGAVAGTTRGEVLRIANSVAVNSLNPHDDQTPATFSFYTWIYEGLVRQNADGSFGPWLAQSWETSEDGLTISFNLNEGITFSDGTPFDANAVKANIDFVKTGPEDQVIPPVAGQLANVDSVEVVDELRVAFHLKAPGEIALISWLSRNSGLMVSPTHLGAAGSTPVGTGPYVYNGEESNVDRTQIVLDANEAYWKPDLVGYNKVQLDVVNDPTARKTAFEAGQYDLAVASPELGEPAAGTTILGPSVIISFTVVDWQGQTIPALGNKDARCAMAAALNREGVAGQMNLPPEAIRTQWAATPEDYAHIDDLAVPGFDIEAAKANYAAAGAEGFSFSNGYLPGTAFENVSLAWAGALGELGITMTNEPFDPPSGGEMFGAFGAGKYPIQVIPINEPHPLMTLQQRATAGGTLNPSKAVPAGVEELVTAASGKNNEDAEADIEAAWKIMLEECIWIPWVTLYDGYWVQDNVTGVEKINGIPIGMWPQGVRPA